jgi:hypothetical protein
MTKAEIIVAFVLEQEGNPYIYGATGAVCTPSYRRARQAQYPDFAPTIARHCPVLSGKQSTCTGCKWNGKRAFDCAQLTRRAAKAAGLTLPSGSKSQFYSDNWAGGGPIEQMPRNQVAFLYRVRADGSVPHTGIYLGDGTYIDARGHAQGVVHEPLGKYKWTHYKIHKGLYISKETEVIGMILSRGSQGEDVRKVQQFLMYWGHDLGRWGADGKFGAQTEKAVREFQDATELPITGVWGDQEWAKMEEINNRPPVEISDMPPVVPDTPQPIDRVAMLTDLENCLTRALHIVRSLREVG